MKCGATANAARRRKLPLYGKVPWFHAPAIKIPIGPGTEFGIARLYELVTWIGRADDNFDHRRRSGCARGDGRPRPVAGIRSRDLRVRRAVPGIPPRSLRIVP